jgi:pimeloyl-ACP methyl ester carboxylesterase
VRIGLTIWIAVPAALLVTAILLGTGIVGLGRAVRDTNYRFVVGAQQPHKVAVVDGIAIAYSDSGGSGPALICLPAIGHGARDFEDLSRRLSPQYRVLALDFPDQGNSGPDVKPASATRYADLLSQFIDQLNLKDVVLIGNSIGGAASIRYANTHSRQVKALILCDPGGLGKPSLAGKMFVAGFVQFFAAGRRGALWYGPAFKKYYEHVLIMAPAREERDRIVRSAYEIALPSEQAWEGFAKPEENLLPTPPKIQCPVLLAWAKQDFVVPLRYSQPSFGSFRNYKLELFEGGHAAFLEDPDHFEQCIRAFLQDVEIHPWQGQGDDTLHSAQ